MKELKYLFYLLLFSCMAEAQNPDTWTRVANFGGSARTYSLGFSVDSFGYVGLGKTADTILGGSTYLLDLWQYDLGTNTWTQKANFPGPETINAISFTIGSKAYIGLGAVLGTSSVRSDFWEYDPATNTWTQKANFPSGPRDGAIGFSIGAKGYVGLGASDTTYGTKDFWQYDPATDTWTQKADFAGGIRANATGFSIGKYGYVGLGLQFSFGYHYMKDFWQYDTLTDSWSQKADYPDTAIILPFSFVIGNRAYVGTGEDSANNFHSSLWEYNSLTDQWIEKDSFGGGNRQGVAGFSIGNIGYAGTGEYPDDDHTFTDFWMYTPDSIATGIKNIDNDLITIYPNPTSDKLFINSSLTNASLSISDMADQSWQVQKTGNEIDISALPSGVYCLRLQNGNSSLIRKFTKL
jgi:N-acetylneuraminic acid mutarotase